MTLEFVNQESVPDYGFFEAWYFSPGPCSRGPCNVTLTQPSGSINSRDCYFPPCFWTIEIPSGQVELYIDFLYVSEMHSGGCETQYVRIYDGYPWNSGYLLRKICYYTTEVFYSSSNVMTVEFVNAFGFFGVYGFFGAHYSSSKPSPAGPPTIGPPTYGPPTYEATTPGQGNETLTQPSGNIYSSDCYIPPCFWTIEIPYGQVNLYFLFVRHNTVNLFWKLLAYLILECSQGCSM
ncbi:uncharacterized protein LOC130283131 [Hyla sarda]|uniref:uncharacterized protein LOC130283131 n=1 Tax=Hyla sarda TaxID=327740 RepID=UPI0024C24C49|nr:uncharacterized protein LOC130283131 [Hyla sarda]